MDESGSIGRAPGGFEDEVEAAVNSFANALKTGTTGLGILQMGIVDFSTEAATTIGLPLKDVKEPKFSSKVTNYLNSNYVPVGGQTNFEAALNKAKSIAGVNFIFFILDGNPNGGGLINVWRGIANSIKSSGTYIFGLAVGSGITECNIIALSGPDELNNPRTFGNGADWTSTNFNLLGAELLSFANSLIDTQAPVLNCSPNIRTSTETGKCGDRNPSTRQRLLCGEMVALRRCNPNRLKVDDAVAGADCKLMTNPMDPVTVQIINPLLGEAIKLKILVRLKPSLGTTKLSAIPCEMHFIVRQALAPNPDVNELLRVTDLTMGNINVNLLVPEHALHLLKVLKCVNAGRSVCNP